jgi:hypothetical protein
MRWGLLWIAALPACGGAEGGVGALADACGGCHPAQAAEHGAARHAVAATSPVFRALADAAEATWRARAFCEGCHRPAGGTEAGLGCLTCHAAYGNLGPGDGALLLDLEGPVRAPGDGARAPHPTAQGGFLTSADLCGTCHEVAGPGPFRESPLEHWRASPAAARGDTCQRCHLRAPGGAVQHRPVGLVGGSPEEVQALLSSAVALSVVAVEGGAEARLRAVADGHRLPDGASFLRGLWLDVAVDGDVVERSWLSARLMAGPDEVVLPTAADRAEDRSLAPGAVRAVRVAAPPGARVQACLRFQRYRPELVAALGLPAEEAGPVVEVVCAEGVAP